MNWVSGGSDLSISSIQPSSCAVCASLKAVRCGSGCVQYAAQRPDWLQINRTPTSAHDKLPQPSSPPGGAAAQPTCSLWSVEEGRGVATAAPTSSSRDCIVSSCRARERVGCS